ncbi:MAG: hypothetical protein MJ196_11045 [Treponemataceae bacterium]|nr:hypothetical protein [Treponemataceae bacterium]
MVYPFMSLNDGTQIVHSELKDDGSVKVYIERPKHLGFDTATCWLPSYCWEDISGFSQDEISYLKEFIESVSHVIIELAGEGGFENASGF